ncbi:transposase [Chryseobacterium sp. SL1]|uniref:transposase n=1 Tax=Chryseobacterium sp. SL1 TaxID=2995159 RepID=UPI0022768162|nr:transposase [Chryseobacterium sp. SL1]MCY1662502.1 transposase [Chryseobacterium sp. SL1]
MNFKNIHIGSLINQRIIETNTDLTRICNFMNTTENEIEKMLISESIDSGNLLKWSKLLEYDFFRIYSQHLILYSPPTSSGSDLIKKRTLKSHLPSFRKNIYTKEIIDFILEQINSGEYTKSEVIEKYGIPKTTLYKWFNKYENQKTKDDFSK